MSKKYNEIMDQVRVTDEMKQRVLQNVKDQMEAEITGGERSESKSGRIQKQESEKTPESGKIIRNLFLTYGRTSRYLSVAACIMMLLVGGMTVPRLLHRGNGLPPEQTGEAVGMAPGETMVGLEVPGSEAGQEELGGQAGAMVGNGMVEVDSLAELSQALGFSVPEVKHIPFEVTGIVYTNGWNEFAQVEYQGGDLEKGQEESPAENQMEGQTVAEEVLFRKARGTDDISGDYNAYSDVKEITVNETAVTLKGENGQYKLAIWQQDGFTYSLSWEPGGSEDVFTEMIRSIP